MAPTTIRKAIGAVKDQTSISLAKVAGNMAPDLEVLIVKATMHDDEPADDKYVREIMRLMSSSRSYVSACVMAISKRLSKTHDWIVALKALMLVHRLLVDGGPFFWLEITYASYRGMRVLNMSGFRDETHSNSWDQSSFVRVYSTYLDQKLEFMVYERNLTGVEDLTRLESRNGEFREENGYGLGRRAQSYGDMTEVGGRDDKNGATPVREMKPERVLERLNKLLGLLDRFLACNPTGAAKSSRIVLVALNIALKESFKLYKDLCEVLGVLLDQFPEMEYVDCLKAFDAYVNAARRIDELSGFYNWCQDVALARSFEFPEVERISDKLLVSMEGYLREKENRPSDIEGSKEEYVVAVEVEEREPNINYIKALPPPENYTAAPPLKQPQQKFEKSQEVTEDLVNLKEDGVSADQQGNKLALALFSGPPAAAATNGSWETFASEEEPKVTSAWQTPAAESGRADWELALVESASNLSKQTADLAGGFDPLLLNGMYDQGAVRQHVNTSQMSGGSASSVALPGMGKSATPLLALPAPDGTMQPVGHQDPFAASLSVPPPSYIQIADMEKKQHLLMQEQHIWEQYASNGMQGQLSLTKIAGNAGYYGSGMQPMMMPYGMPQVSGMGHPGPGGYYAPY